MTKIWALSYIRAGKSFSSKIKISFICILKMLRNRSPEGFKQYFDIPVRGMSVETDVKFVISTLYDFFVFSPIWERQLTDVFQFKEGMNFVDVGAHIGRYTVRAGKKVGAKGKVVAIEPDKDNFRFLSKNVCLNDLQNCFIFNVAAYNEDSEISLFIGTDTAKNSVTEDSGRGSYKVKARALDNVLREVGMEKVDLIKVDVEGAEYEVLRGLERTLSHGNPRLMVEILVKDKDRVIRYLKSLGYEENLIHSYLPFKGGINYYLFTKSPTFKDCLV